MKIEFHAIYNWKKATPAVLISNKQTFRQKAFLERER